MSDLLTLKRRYQNINAVYEITDAMEVIATIIIGRAQKFLNYRKSVMKQVEMIFKLKNCYQYLTDSPSPWVIMFFSEKGFSGNFNPQMLPLVSKFKNYKNIIVVGTRGRGYVERLGINHAHHFEGIKKITTEDVIEPVYKLLEENGLPRNIIVLSNCYANMFVQTPKQQEFFKNEKIDNIAQPKIDIDEEDFIRAFLKIYVKSKLYGFYVENYAGEVAAKLLMMKNATESAQKLKSEVAREVFKARQTKITQELSEVISAYKVLQSQRERR